MRDFYRFCEQKDRDSEGTWKRNLRKIGAKPGFLQVVVGLMQSGLVGF